MSVYSFEKPQSLIVRLVELRVGRDFIQGKEMERKSTHYSISYHCIVTVRERVISI